jgi:hypothetical protein
MGFMYVLGPCCTCGTLMHYSAERVPSIRIDGVREPVCRHCIERANPVRIANGLEPIEILSGAYDPDEV